MIDDADSVEAILAHPIWESMKRWTYPATIEHHKTDVGSDTYLVAFADFPEAVTEAASLDEVQFQAGDALATVVIAYMNRGLGLPAPQASGPGEVPVLLDPWLAASALLASTMVEQGLTAAALAARLGKHEKKVRMALDPRCPSLRTLLLCLREVGVAPALSSDREAGF